MIEKYSGMNVVVTGVMGDVTLLENNLAPTH